jgi:uncharacterized DUF497 family protein
MPNLSHKSEDGEKLPLTVFLRIFQLSFAYRLQPPKVFGDPLAMTIEDPLHSEPDAQRFITLGMSGGQILLIVVHCDRGRAIRIISARKATRREKKEYEEQ